MQPIFYQYFTQNPADNTLYTYRTHGRVNLIGEHLDYNGGNVLPFIIPQGIQAQVQWNNSTQICVFSENYNGRFVFNITQNNSLEPCTELWQKYIKAILQALANEEIILQGANILLQSNMPAGAGLSSSAALEALIISFFLNLPVNALHPLNKDAVQRAKFCQYIENKYIGVNCGIMDQFAVIIGKPHKAVLLNCETLEHSFIDFNISQSNYNLLIINSNLVRNLANSVYNKRVQECEVALKGIQKQCGKEIKNLCNIKANMLQVLEHEPIEIRNRAIHVYTEQARVTEAVACLQSKNWERLGQLLNESHHSLHYYYDVCGENLNVLVTLAQQIEGCIGARMTGAGFGGCAIALVEKTKTDFFKTLLVQAYNKKTGVWATFLNYF